jgi:DNA-binding MarR family transcriptional regulator
LAQWSLLTNHARLLLAIEREPDLRIRDMAERLNLSERGIQLILRDLHRSGYITAQRDDGDRRRINYRVVSTKPLRTKSVSHHTVGELLALLTEAEASGPSRQGERGRGSSA